MASQCSQHCEEAGGRAWEWWLVPPCGAAAVATSIDVNDRAAPWVTLPPTHSGPYITAHARA